jgi:sirohydrochlorin cobaltochelatase
MKQGILLVGHGSRDREGSGQFLALAGAIGARAPWPVEPAFLDHAAPTIPAGIEQLVARGVSRVGVVPLFLFAAGHAKRDVPALLAAARQRYPGVRFRYGRPLGVEPALAEACAALLAGGGHLASPGETAVLLVGRGSSDPEADDGLRQVAGLVQATTGARLVECAYCDVAEPRVEEGLRRCMAPGIRRVVLLPYFLFRGVLMTRLQALLARWQEQQGDREFCFAGAEGIGHTPGIADLVLERAAEVFR